MQLVRRRVECVETTWVQSFVCLRASGGTRVKILMNVTPYASRRELPGAVFCSGYRCLRACQRVGRRRERAGDFGAECERHDLEQEGTATAAPQTASYRCLDKFHDAYTLRGELNRSSQGDAAMRC